MILSQLTLHNFQSFGDPPVTVKLDDLTALIGTNGTGKTALLQALLRLFGTSTADRQLRTSDFHVPAGECRSDADERSLAIEARIEFPELASAEDDDSVCHLTVPPLFSDMTIEEPGGAPFCRIRLEGTWRQTNVAEGDIEQRLFWITSGSASFEEENVKPVSSHERSCIHVEYLPAVRNASSRQADFLRSVLNRLIAAVEWSEDTKSELSNAAIQTSQRLSEEKGADMIQGAIQASWDELYDGRECTEISLGFMEAELEEVLRTVRLVYTGEMRDEKYELRTLSEGPTSLLYFSLAHAALELEARACARECEDTEGSGINYAKLAPPSLTILAVEEPENHVAPHYLGRLMGLLTRTAGMPSAQVLVTSHSPSIMSRVDPIHVRHFRLSRTSATSLIREITLPPDSSEAFKYIENAVMAYPELYFSRLVLLVEGSSEEVVLPRIANAQGFDMDHSLISVVPLGGRHVNHFWRLLNSLNVPYLTLLDLDLGRYLGGWGRVKYVCKQLKQIGQDPQTLFDLAEDPESDDVEIALEDMHKRDLSDLDLLARWKQTLEESHVYFSAPVDFDMVMLRHFKEAYIGTADELKDGCEPEVDEEKTADQKAAIARAVGGTEEVEKLYLKWDDCDLFPWYCHLFLDRSKPATHLQALSSIEDEVLAANTPGVLSSLVEAMRDEIQAPREEQ